MLWTSVFPYSHYLSWDPALYCDLPISYLAWDSYSFFARFTIWKQLRAFRELVYNTEPLKKQATAGHPTACRHMRTNQLRTPP